MVNIFWGVFVFFLAIAVYMLPTIIADHRRKKNVNAIAALNVLFGWTFVGWGIALVWALMGDN